MAEWRSRSKVEVWAYCLMLNHIHLIAVSQSEEGLRRAMVEARIGSIFGRSIFELSVVSPEFPEFRNSDRNSRNSKDFSDEATIPFGVDF